MPSTSHLTCTPTKSNLCFTNSLATVVSEPDLYIFLTFHVPNRMFLFHCLGCTNGSFQVRHRYLFHNKASFYGDELLAPCPSPMQEDHPLLAVCNCLFNIFTAPLHIGSHSSIQNLRMCHAMVAGTYHGLCYVSHIILCYKNNGLSFLFLHCSHIKGSV